MKLLKKIKLKDLFFYLFLYSIISLSFALYLEHVLLYKPCQLCLYQRVSFVLLLFFSLIGFFFYEKIIWLYIIMAIFILNILISGYHSGIELGIFNEFSLCSSDFNNNLDKEKILESLNTKMPSCKDVTFKLFGLSLATINFFISLFVCFLLYIKIIHEKNR